MTGGTTTDTTVQSPLTLVMPIRPEARDALSRLEFYSLISPQERETILENVVQFDGRVGLDELDYLLSWIVCGNRDFESQQTIYSVMEGQADTFH